MEQRPIPVPAHHGRFVTTRWSLIVAAGLAGGTEATDALAQLCSLYWYPVYAFIRRRGYPADQADDLTQGFFARLLEKNEFSTLDRRRGRFRSWLLAAVSHSLANTRKRDQAQKRGGGAFLLSIEGAQAEERYLRDAVDDETPERIFERQWALLLVERAITALRGEWARTGKEPLFERLRGHLVGEQGEATYRQVADELGMTPGAVKVAAHRLRYRLRALLEAEVTETLEHPDEMEDELRQLLACLG